MIFVTTGTQLPFDRLVSNVDEWAGRHNFDVFAQIGSSKTKPTNIRFSDFLSASETEEMFKQCSAIISHAGMGTVLNALKYKKPLIAMPRIAAKGEHRNEHQLATAKWIADIDGVNVAWDEKELWEWLGKIDSLSNGSAISESASPELIQNLKNFLHQ